MDNEPLRDRKAVILIDLETQEVRRFPSRTDAACFLGASSGNISRAIRRRLSNKGFLVRDVKDFVDAATTIREYHEALYASARGGVAGRPLCGLPHRSRWQRPRPQEKRSIVEKKRAAAAHRRKPIRATSYLTGEVRDFESVNAAGRQGFATSNVTRVLQGRSHTAYGYVWQYLDEISG